jgi:hypothetical protein
MRQKVMRFIRRVRKWTHDFLHAPRLIDQFEAILSESTQAVKPDPFGRFKRAKEHKS